MAKRDSNPPYLLHPLKPVDYNRSRDIHPELDITRPRDIYNFLSLGYVNTDQIPTLPYTGHRAGIDRLAATERHIIHLTPDENQHILSSDFDWQKDKSSYILFDTLNTHSKIPAIENNQNLNEDVSNNNAETADNKNNNNDIQNAENDQIYSDFDTKGPRKSLITEEDCKINITQTYIFAPEDRIKETFRYNKNIILPKIKKRSSRKDDTTNTTTDVKNHQSPAVESPTKSKVKRVQIDPNPVQITPTNTKMNVNNYIFGTRPECLLIHNRLGDKNPLLRGSKESPTLSIPKSSPGLSDLKDYDEYPHVYWELRDGTIAQPEDLENDMIDRDLYRLRQLSTLKLNSIERTFQFNHDPFRRWRWKGGDPIFSPRQQQRPLALRSYREKKAKDIPVYPLALSKPKGKVNFSLLKHSEYLSSLDVNKSSNMDAQNDVKKIKIDTQHIANNDQTQNDEILALPPFETPRGSSLGNTPRDAVAASLETFRRLDEEMEDNAKFGKIPIQKMYQLRGKQHKTPVRTTLVNVDLEPLDSCRREQRSATIKPNSKSPSKGVGHSHKLESYRESQPSDQQLITNHPPMSPTQINGEENNESSQEKTEDSDTSGSPRKKVPVQVATLLLQPDLSRLSLYPPGDVINSWDVDTGTLSSDTALVKHRPGTRSPVVSDSSNACKEKKDSNSSVKVKQRNLNVFSERQGQDSDYITIPTGRVSYYKSMPAFKLDLSNYPPSNARQSCQRSTSAGVSDGHRTLYTANTSMTAASRQQDNGLKSSGQPRDLLQSGPAPPKTGDTNISIKFGEKGQVIVSSSREGRRSR